MVVQQLLKLLTKIVFINKAASKTLKLLLLIVFAAWLPIHGL